MKIATPSKAETTLLLPFTGLSLEQIHLPETTEQLAAAAAEIIAAGIAGFDTESKPTFVKGDVSAGPHVIQFALHDKAFIFQLNNAACRPFLIQLLTSANVLKVGFGLESDRRQIQAKLDVSLNAVLDLNSEFRKQGYRSTAGVRAAVAIVLNQKFHKSKRATTSNWALPQLSAQQLLYAANDAFAALAVWKALNSSVK